MTLTDKVLTTKATGRRGRPKKIINPSLLKNVFGKSRHITLTQLARVLGVHRHTVRANLRTSDIYQNAAYTEIEDADLDERVQEFNMNRPDSGGSYLMGHLTSRGQRIQRWRVREAQRRVDRVAVHIRSHHVIRRRVYSVKRPNSLWHMDGYHKLSPLGIVIHGVVDGFSRKVRVAVFS